jgi:hypothetical protein
MQDAPLLTKARGAYQQAMTATAELRNILDASDGSLRTLMTQLQQAINVHVNQPAPDKKKPELVKVKALVEHGENIGVAKGFLP